MKRLNIREIQLKNGYTYIGHSKVRAVRGKEPTQVIRMVLSIIRTILYYLFSMNGAVTVTQNMQKRQLASCL